MDLWFTEKIEEKLGLTLKIKSTLHAENTPYQRIDVLETEALGKMLLLDGAVMLTERDEFIYHEMITHVPLSTHPHPRHVLVIGGGDGGTVREILKHPSVEQIDLVEIDVRVIEICQTYFPQVSQRLNDPRVKLRIEDGIHFVKKTSNPYDIVLVDSTDPVGPAKGLFEETFFKDIHRCLRQDGIMVAQSESPFLHPSIIQEMVQTLKKIFPIVKIYLAPIPTYPSGLWSFAFCSKEYDPLLHFHPRGLEPQSRYYNEEIHRSAFSLPNFIKEWIE
jgi:spermidine synthase